MNWHSEQYCGWQVPTELRAIIRKMKGAHPSVDSRFENMPLAGCKSWIRNRNQKPVFTWAALSFVLVWDNSNSWRGHIRILDYQCKCRCVGDFVQERRGNYVPRLVTITRAALCSISPALLAWRPLMQLEKRPRLVSEMRPAHWTPFAQICSPYRLCTADWLSGRRRGFLQIWAKPPSPLRLVSGTSGYVERESMGKYRRLGMVEGLWVP